MRPLEAKRLLKAVIALELAGVFGAYGLFTCMNNSRDFRSKVNTRFPRVLKAYYLSNEYAGVYGIRERDQEAWSQQD